jgi:hypothetical protein
MNKVTRVKNENFTIISNVFLKDKKLSIKAKGFLAVVMGLPSDWEFTINGVCSIIKEGKTAIYNVIDELKVHGYCNVVTCRDEKGRITGNDYTFYEEPQLETQVVDCPRMENLDMDNQPQLNTYNIKDLFDKEEKEDKSSKKNESKLGVYIEIHNKWEELNPQLPSIRCFNEKRKKALKTLLKNNNATIDDLYKVFEIISICSFCQGNNDRKWTATLDWVLNDTKGCFNRLLEGAYAFSESEKQRVQQIVNNEQPITQQTSEQVIIGGQIYR